VLHTDENANTLLAMPFRRNLLVQRKFGNDLLIRWL
jgi:hypothetical protein